LHVGGAGGQELGGGSLGRGITCLEAETTRVVRAGGTGVRWYHAAEYWYYVQCEDLCDSLLMGSSAGLLGYTGGVTEHRIAAVM
jgi:hypothetical protein